MTTKHGDIKTQMMFVLVKYRYIKDNTKDLVISEILNQQQV